MQNDRSERLECSFFELRKNYGLNWEPCNSSLMLLIIFVQKRKYLTWWFLSFLSFFFCSFDSSKNPYKTFISQPPLIHSQPLKNLKDLMVCKVGAYSEMPPDVALIGNGDFSIPLYCEGDKLFCRNRNCQVRLLPGIDYYYILICL